MLGLKRGTVALYPHEEQWELEAERTIEVLRAVLGDTATDICHIGSTAIPQIAAKPIIDIAVATDDFDTVLSFTRQLRDAGFYLRDTEFCSQLLFAAGSVYDGTGDEQTHFIHVVKTGSMDYINYINFRNYLIAKPEVAREYEALKLRLMSENPVDCGREKYLAGKQAFITYTLRKALVWSYMGKTVTVRIDRPVGYVHKKEAYSLTYPINYGYIPGVIGGDGEELDVYVLGVDKPVVKFTGRVIATVHREDDNEDKLVAAPAGSVFNAAEIAHAVRFQEQYYKSFVEII